MGRISFATLLFYLFIPSVMAVINNHTYSFEAVLPKEQFRGFNKEQIQKQVRLFVQPHNKVFYSINITSVDSTTGTVYFDITWDDIELQVFGDPPDFAELARDVLGWMKIANIEPTKFRMNAPPPPPVSLSASDINSHSITITWKHPRYFDVDFYQVQMSNVSDNVNWTNFTRVNGSNEAATLDGLESNTKYRIRLASANRYGIGARKSNILEVETKKDQTEGESKDDTVTIVLVVVIFVIVILLAMGTAFYWRRKQQLAAKRTNPYQDSIPGIDPSSIYSRDDRTFFATDASSEEYISWYEIERDNLTMSDVLGEGEFGLVVKATWKDEKTNTNIAVAVKSVKDTATEDDRKELFKELKLMAEVGEHPNVVNLIGACSNGGPLWVIVEFCEHGNLLSFIRKNRTELCEDDRPFKTSLDTLTRVKFACDISKGMSYLEGKKIIHRDLAARNVLLGRSKVAKVSDFGLSRDIYEIGLYQKMTGGRLPVKWMAIESLQEATYTCKSDVWSFGILFWEIETAGMVPYPGISGLDLLPHLQRGYRLPKPPETLTEMYEIMKACWESNPDERPSFIELERILQSYMATKSEYLPVIVDEEVTEDPGNTAYANYVVPIVENESGSYMQPLIQPLF